MTRWVWTIFFLAVSLTGGCGGTKSADLKPQQFVFGGETRNYAVYVPKGYEPTRSYPTIFFLHGLFEGGNDGHAMTGVGIGPALAKHPERFNGIVVMAQTSGSWRNDDQMPLAMATLDDAVRKFNIDANRVVLTGLSTGGAGVYKLGANYRDRFAALMPMCGHAVPELVPRLTKIPVWAFTNSTDPFVPSSNARTMVEKINKAGGNAQLTVFSSFGHNCWDDAYGDPKVVDWMLSRKRK
jgi:predicted peptidase